MSLNQFAVVEELACLIKDNLPCKHLVLSVEEALVDFLQDETSSDGVLELEPMNSYNRLLLHRLADIFGFSHESVGEGDNRHLILERCPETSIPSILVSDLLWQYDDFESPPTSQLLSRRQEASAELKSERPTSQISLEEREAAYLAARERIFSINEEGTKGPVKQKPRNDPVVARRMIAHALGQRMKDPEGYAEQTDERTNQEKNEGASYLSLGTCPETNILCSQNVDSCGKPKASSALLLSDRKVPQKQADKISTKVGISGSGKNERTVSDKDNQKEHMGAAKRMFAHALGIGGFHSTRDGVLSKCGEMKQQTNRGGSSE